MNVRPAVLQSLLGRARRRLASTLLAEPLEHMRSIPFRDAGHGYDVFGYEPLHAALSLSLMEPLHRYWFRVRSHGTELIPAQGPALLVGNHSGTLPFDAMMVWTDVILRCRRLPRPVADHFVPALPFVSTLYARAGVVGGTAGNLRVLLEAGELLMIFPEGVPGIAKPFRERYQLREFRVGHAELAIRHQAPVVPVGIVGAEEQMPQVARLPVHAFGAPYLPVPLTPLPLPVRYHLHYGEPLRLHEGLRPEDADDPEVVRRAAERVRLAVQALVDKGLRLRKGVFR
ncbi:lysophospholipid acyltransferase family protein [Archangium sp.]|uniref:lysophospholipid acyltransferase family protein n=1 Tax=Archangium sp. TaxID=1872627 RepID=UPI002D6C4DFC|nr:lysophospholipid acyltransferase family protein [Archangium sp.]HYO59421.1 lysophospholipid acyltransferase family protein [Archangium sp.]